MENSESVGKTTEQHPTLFRPSVCTVTQMSSLHMHRRPILRVLLSKKNAIILFIFIRNHGLSSLLVPGSIFFVNYIRETPQDQLLLFLLRTFQLVLFKKTHLASLGTVDLRKHFSNKSKLFSPADIWCQFVSGSRTVDITSRNIALSGKTTQTWNLYETHGLVEPIFWAKTTV